jgi:DNA (cytosine-5)-methyltransferase 1
MLRVIALARPTWVVGENVTGLIPLALDDVLFDLEALGYATRTFVIPAVAVDAPHRRDRLWIVATNTNGQQHKGGPSTNERPASTEFSSYSNSDGQSTGAVNAETPRMCDVADTEHSGFGGRNAERRGPGTALPSGWWQFEPDVGRVAHGVPRRVDRLRCLGNAVVPQVVEEIGRAIMRCARA